MTCEKALARSEIRIRATFYYIIIFLSITLPQIYQGVCPRGKNLPEGMFLW